MFVRVFAFSILVICSAAIVAVNIAQAQLVDTPSIDPAQFNAAKLTKVPADELSGPPVVTCKAWGIMDGKTGAMVAGHQHEQSLAIASTTKMMTAYLVLGLAEKSPGVLDEELTFSRQADDTGGTTADIRAGERLPVREVLFGLMLPSGNDAAVALAEHFGDRFRKMEANGKPVAAAVFVDEMNLAAERLGMRDTHYSNPHGLSEAKHLSTAADQLRLAHSALQLKSFADYVATRQRACVVTAADGTRRTVAWKNTNRLLEIEGFDGVKTGTTSAAGACLVSRGTRDGKTFLVCVLGATSTDARYVDTRNLFRWAWREKL